MSLSYRLSRITRRATEEPNIMTEKTKGETEVGRGTEPEGETESFNIPNFPRLVMSPTDTD